MRPPSSAARPARSAPAPSAACVKTSGSTRGSPPLTAARASRRSATGRLASRPTPSSAASMTGASAGAGGEARSTASASVGVRSSPAVRRLASGATQTLRQRLQARPRHRVQHERPGPCVAVRRGLRQPRLDGRRGGELGQAALEERTLVVAGRQVRQARAEVAGERLTPVGMALGDPPGGLAQPALARVEERYDGRRRQRIAAHLIEGDQRRPACPQRRRRQTRPVSPQRHRSRSARRSPRARRRDRAASRRRREQRRNGARAPQSGRAPRQPRDERAGQATPAVRSAPDTASRIAPEADAMHRDALDASIAIAQRRPDGAPAAVSGRRIAVHSARWRTSTDGSPAMRSVSTGSARSGTEARQRLDGAAPHGGPRVGEAANQRRRRHVPPVETTSARVGDRRRAALPHAVDRAGHVRLRRAARSGSRACTSRRCRPRAGCRRRPR